MMFTPYTELNEVLEDLVKSMQEILDDNFIGAYLQGSFAVGGFDIHSDVDFIVAINKEITNTQLNNLQAMHERIYQKSSSWAQHLEGSYFPKEILRHHANSGKDIWYLDNGSRKLIQSHHCNTILVRWVVREKGVTLAGPPPKTLIEKIDADVLRQEIFNTINNWGKEIILKHDTYNNVFYQTFIVLNYCRMLHDLKNGTNGSKRSGAEWAKKNLDSSWTDLIDRAWLGRPKPEITVRTPADSEDFTRTLKFIEYVMEESKQYLASKG